MVSSAWIALRRGRNPNDETLKSASKIGSMTSFITIRAIRFFTVGMPSGRSFP